jgi:transcriptional regulator with XRE-family HTH domain
MARHVLSEEERGHGKRLGSRLSQVRGQRGLSAQAVAVAANVSIDTVRSLETGRVVTPGFLTVARLAEVLGLNLDQLHRDTKEESS